MFRLETFNIFNRTQAGNPGITFTSAASFGLVNSGLNRTIGSGTARQLQVALRLPSSSPQRKGQANTCPLPLTRALRPNGPIQF